MKNILVLLLMTTLNYACSQTKQASEKLISQAEEVVAKEYEYGIFKMGIIDYQAKDALSANTVTTKNLIDQLSPQLEYDIYYSSEAIATVLNDAEGNLKSRTIFLYEEDQVYDFLYADGKKYYTVLPGRQAQTWTDQSKLYFERIFKINPTRKKEIQGFKCKYVKIMDPVVPGKSIAEVYVTDEIPYLTKGFGHLGKMINGLPLETTMTIQGLEITTGAIKHSQTKLKNKYLELNLEGFEQLSYNAFNLMKEKF